MRTQEEAQIIADKVADALFAHEAVAGDSPTLSFLHTALAEAQAALIEDGVLAAIAARDGGQKGGGEEPDPIEP